MKVTQRLAKTYNKTFSLSTNYDKMVEIFLNKFHITQVSNVLGAISQFTKNLDSLHNILNYFQEESINSNLEQSLLHKDTPERYEIMLNLLIRAGEKSQTLSELVEINESNFKIQYFQSHKDKSIGDAILVDDVTALFKKCPSKNITQTYAFQTIITMSLLLNSFINRCSHWGNLLDLLF